MTNMDNKYNFGDVKANAIGDNSTSITVTNNNFFDNFEKEESKENNTINEILETVLLSIKQTGNTKTQDLNNISLDEKITLNFKEDIDFVKRNCIYALTKIKAIEKRIQSEDPETQNELQSYIYNKYYDLKLKGLNNINILMGLFKDQDILPSKKINDTTYNSLSKAFILFFFEDCTIFEKTTEEREK